VKTLELPALDRSRLTENVVVGENLRVLGPDEEPPVGFGVLRIMTPRDGDKRVVWNPDSFTEIREASELFKELLKAGMVPYVVDPATGRPTQEVMAEFDPSSGEVDFREVVFAPKKLAAGG
jgi:hypothetical protein